eukprot:GAHX01000790.1.p1 GENE.GAHX01000790.1~~GAHX01000790.1.p1  ORF type:complete len:1095 (-),score=284.36 GAHX01000790.1:1707-4991(-)
MLLINIFINGFRSYASPTNIQLSAANTILQGENGSGKSSIIQAIRYGLGYKYTSLSNMDIKNMLSESPGKDWRSAEVIIRLTLSIATLTKEQRTCLKNGKFPIAEENNEIILERKIDLENDTITCNESKLNVTQLFYLLNVLKITQMYEFSNIISQNTIHTIVDMGAAARTRLLKNYIGVSAFEKQIKGLSGFLDDLDKKDIPKLEESKTFIVEQLDKLESERDGLKELKDLEFKKDLLEYRISEQKKGFLVKKLKATEKLLQDSQKRISSVEEKREKNEIEITEKRKEKNKLKTTKHQIPEITAINTVPLDQPGTAKDHVQKAKEIIKRNEKSWRAKVNVVFKSHEILIRNNLVRFKKKIEKQNVLVDSNDLKAREITLKTSVATNDEKLKVQKKKQKKLEKTIKDINSRDEKLKAVDKLKSKTKGELNELKFQRRKIWEEQNNKNEELNELMGDRKELQKRFRYAISLKNVLALRFARGLDRNAGVYGALLDQIKTDARYNKAVIASLGKRLFTVLVENDESLKYCLNELRKFNGDNAASGLPFISVTFMKVPTDQSSTNVAKRKQGVDFKKFKPLSALLEVTDKRLKPFITNSISASILFIDKIVSSTLDVKGFKVVDVNGIVASKGSIEGGYIEDYLTLNNRLGSIEEEIAKIEIDSINQNNELEQVNKLIENKQTELNRSKESGAEDNIHDLVKYRRKQRVLEMNINKITLSNDYLETQLRINKELAIKLKGGAEDDAALMEVLNNFIKDGEEKEDVDGYSTLSSFADELEEREEGLAKPFNSTVGMRDVTNVNSDKPFTSLLGNKKGMDALKGKIRKLLLKKVELERHGEVLMADINSKLRDKNIITENLSLIQTKIDRVDDRYKDEKEGIKISLNEHNKAKSDVEINREISLIDTQLENVRKSTNKKADLYYERFLAKKIQIDKNVEEIFGLQTNLTQHLETFENIKAKFFTGLSNGIIKEFKQLMFYFDRALSAKIELKDGKLEFSAEVKDYSGGQKALVGLCFTLAIKFAFGLDLMVLDEVDANLDVEYVKKFAALIKRESGKGKIKGQVLLSSFKEDILNLEGDKKIIEISYEDGYSNIKETDY